MKYLVVPDSFKGTIDAREVCGIISREIARLDPDSEIVRIPVADGGEGTVDCFLSALDGQRVTARVSGPRFLPVEAAYALVDSGQTAVIEMAACAGLPLAEDPKDPERTTTYGVGELIRDALDRGAKRLLLGLGGSCTNDGGAGMAAALGVRFLRADGSDFVPTGGTLAEIRRIDRSGLDPRLGQVRIEAMCDVTAPLYGAEGAAFVFGPQKGATPEQTARLDEGLRQLHRTAEQTEGLCSRPETPGAGAAGGLGYGVMTFLGGTLKSGTDAVLDTVGFDAQLRDAGLVLTGEGKFDRQSLTGKVVSGVARRAAAAGVPVAVIAGDLGDGIEEAYRAGVTAVFSTNRAAIPWSEARLRSREDLARTAENVIRLWLAARRGG